MLGNYLLLIATAAAAGVINSVAGGGTLLTFPALFAVLGASPHAQLAATAGVIANATSTVALVPGAAASMWGYRRELAAVSRWAWLLLPPSFVGGLIGSLFVVLWPDKFDALIPWLILTAALLFALQPAITRWTGVGRPHADPTARTKLAVVALQFVIAIYGGYFGAGIGILMLTGLALMGLDDIHAMNGLKTLLNFAINGVSVAVFIKAGLVHWPLAAMMAAAAIVGGYGGAHVARRLNRNLVRRGVVAIGFALAAWYFYQQLSG
ncbi:MAG: sulfite exporter TauE/SafE family protein [Pirellulales bacterium]